MKILWLSHLIPFPPKGGVLQRSYNLLKELSVYHEVDLMAFNQRSLIGPLFSSMEEALSQANQAVGEFCGRKIFFEIPNEVGVGGKYLLAARSIFSGPYSIAWLASKKYREILIDWTIQNTYDAVLFDTISLVPYLKYIPRSAFTILDHHNIESQMLIRRYGNERNILKKLYFFQEGIRLQRYERTYCPRFDINITCSELDTARLRKLVPGAKVETIPNGVDTDYFQPHRSYKNSHRLVFAGTMNWYPNIQAVEFIASCLWARLKTKFPEAEMDVIGANPPRAIKRFGESLQGFKVHGFVDDVRPYLDGATIYVCPINDGGGTKLKILDAMSMAIPIVAHPIACEGIDVTDGHDVLLASDEDSFIEQITRLMGSEVLRRSIGEAARQTAIKQYSYTSIGRQFANLITSSVEQKERN